MEHAASDLSLAQTVQRLESGTATAASLLRETLQAIEAHGDDAIFISLTQERAEREAVASDARRKAGTLLSPLDGVCVAWKDLFDTQGDVTTAGAKVFAGNPPSTCDADVVAACTRLGMICVGKTNLTEFAYSGLGLNPHFGTPKNPHSTDEARIPGGSSSGSAVAVAAGLVPVAVGTDTAGSVRVPASFCGLVGYKSSQNRYSKAGVFALSDSLDSLGVFGHCVDDVMAMDAAMRGERSPIGADVQPDDPASLEIIIPQSVVLDDVAPDILENFDAAIDRLAKAGATINTMPFPIFNEVLVLFGKHGTLVVAEAATLHQELLASDKADLMDQRVRERMLLASNFTAQDYIHLQGARARLQKATSDLLGNRFLLFPTTAMTAPPLAALEASDDLFVSTNLKALRNTMLGNYLGTPGVSLPIGLDRDGLPIGALLSAPYGGDDKVLSAARAIEGVVVRRP